MCKHNWQLILPNNEAVREDDRTDYVIEKMLSCLSGIYYCNKCWHTGHVIKSHRGGMRRHYDGGYFIEKANQIRLKYLLPLLSSGQEDERSVASKADSSTDDGK